VILEMKGVRRSREQVMIRYTREESLILVLVLAGNHISYLTPVPNLANE
jgi:hypothetical protein